MTLEVYMNELLDEEKPIKHAGLLQLSGLDPESLYEFKSAWYSVAAERKTEVLNHLLRLGEDNLELDFSSIFRACLNDSDEEVRVAATRGLWDCDDRVLVRPLLKLLKEDPSIAVRAAAAVSLSKFASMAQDGKILARDGQRIRDALLDIVTDSKEDPEVRRRALESVACYNTPEIETLIHQTYLEDDSTLKQSAMFAMGRSSNTKWLTTVLKELGNDDEGVRYEAATAVGLLGDETVAPHLIGLIKDEDVQVQVAALTSLGTIGGQLAKRAIQQVLSSGDEALEEAATAALRAIEFDEDPLGFKFDG
jgi:HEAT repeat protein